MLQLNLTTACAVSDLHFLYILPMSEECLLVSHRCDSCSSKITGASDNVIDGCSIKCKGLFSQAGSHNKLAQELTRLNICCCNHCYYIPNFPAMEEQRAADNTAHTLTVKQENT